MRQLNYDLKKLCERNRDGSYSTQANRMRILAQIANQLFELGFRDMTIRSLKPKHVRCLVSLWQKEGLSPGTIKNRMCHLRWWSEKIGMKGMIHPSNDAFGIKRRVYVTNLSKAVEPSKEQLDSIQDTHVRASVEFQRQFGLRREEAMKIQPEWADRGDKIKLKGSWTKGGREREIPIHTAAQRAAIEHAKKVAGSGSLIPSNKSYKKHMRKFEKQTSEAGFGCTHGLRHEYAQERYKELADQKPPVAGGIFANQMTPEKRERDAKARLQVSRELGHGRAEISSAYLGGLLSSNHQDRE